MRNLWSRGAAAATALVVLGVSGLMNVLPLLASGGLACIAPIPILAPLGFHLDLLTEVGIGCPEHTFLPGANFGPTMQFFVLLFSTTLVAGIINLLIAGGVVYWMLRAVRGASAWVRSHLRASAPYRPHPPHFRLAAGEPTPLHVGIGLHHPTQRRGPPLTN